MSPETFYDLDIVDHAGGAIDHMSLPAVSDEDARQG